MLARNPLALAPDRLIVKPSNFASSPAWFSSIATPAVDAPLMSMFLNRSVPLELLTRMPLEPALVIFAPMTFTFEPDCALETSIPSPLSVSVEPGNASNCTSPGA